VLSSQLLPLARWLYDGKGALSTNLAEAAAFLRSSDIEADGTVSPAGQGLNTGLVDSKSVNASGNTSPDLEIICAPLYYAHHALEAPPNPSGDYFTLAPTVLRPYSRGKVSIKSGSTFDKPLIDPNYLSDERDLKVSFLSRSLRSQLKCSSRPSAGSPRWIPPHS